jgi:hypothetical protein
VLDRDGVLADLLAAHEGMVGIAKMLPDDVW